ncbi:MAG: Unknown protein [uncultured Sulfurovum sp.]|uniref:Serine/threonine protein kinase n=1 Tax=uncultured Sulfurovum sp. TaxID=269237 RepID=A0A6S6T4Z0_9BACT|nr:MAG: Unknown protein [uncultured Sulfurovum sp.]
MGKNHLAVGHKLGGHYEVVQVLGEDDFEILYWVKDLHMAGQNFVLKELFLLAYASRAGDNSVQVMAKSKQVFEQTKEDIISEIEVLKTHQAFDAPKVYGYFEENNTVYTIMEFINNPNLSIYLDLSTQSGTVQPLIKEEAPLKMEENKIKITNRETETGKEEKKPKSTIFLKILIVLALLLIGLYIYSTNMIEEHKETVNNKSEEIVVKNVPINHPPLEDKVKEKKDENISSSIEAKEENENKKPEGASYIEEGEIAVSEPISIPTLDVESELQIEDVSNLPDAEVYVDETLDSEDVLETPVEFEEAVRYEPNIVNSPTNQTPLSNEVKPNISLGTRIN